MIFTVRFRHGSSGHLFLPQGHSGRKRTTNNVTALTLRRALSLALFSLSLICSSIVLCCRHTDEQRIVSSRPTSVLYLSRTPDDAWCGCTRWRRVEVHTADKYRCVQKSPWSDLVRTARACLSNTQGCSFAPLGQCTAL